MQSKAQSLAVAAAVALSCSLPVTASASSTDAAREAAQNPAVSQQSAVSMSQRGTVVTHKTDKQSGANGYAVKEEVVTKPAASKSRSKAAQPSEERYVENAQIFQTAQLRREATSPNYRLFKGDSVSLLVIGFPDGIGLNGFTVGTDGYVQLPYVGSVKMEGRTLDEAKDLIMASVGRYIKIPDMSLQITGYGPRRVYVMGEVSKPGIVSLSIDSMNAYAALSAAGGWTGDGLSTGIQIMRVVDGTMYWRKLNMKSYARRHDLTQNVVVEEGDILYVPHSNGIKLGRDVLPWFNAWALYKGLTD